MEQNVTPKTLSEIIKRLKARAAEQKQQSAASAAQIEELKAKIKAHFEQIKEKAQ